MATVTDWYRTDTYRGWGAGWREGKEPLAALKSQGLKEIQSVLGDYRYVQAPYGETYRAGTMIPRIMAVALFVIAIITFSLWASNHLLTFPQDFLNLFQQIDYLKLTITGTLFVFLFCGASIIIHRARHKKEPLLARRQAELQLTRQQADNRLVNSTMWANLESVAGALDRETEVKKITLNVAGEAPGRGAFTHLDEYLATARFIHNVPPGTPLFCLSCYLDLSTLDPVSKSGLAFAYHYKNPGPHYVIASEVAFVGTPVYLVGTIVYNILRAVIAPLYVIIQLLRELAMKEDEKLFPDERRFEPSDIGKQFALSIQRVLQAPFYALAYFMAVVYGFFNPMGGRKLAFHIEQDWNDDGLTIDGGFWSIFGPQDYWKFEGGGGPDSLGKNGFSLAGCYWPCAVVVVENGEILGAYRTSVLEEPTELLKPDAIYHFQTQTEKAFIGQAAIELLESEVEKLTRERGLSEEDLAKILKQSEEPLPEPLSRESK